MSGEALKITSNVDKIRYAIPDFKLPHTTKGLLFHVCADRYDKNAGLLINTADPLDEKGEDGFPITSLPSNTIPDIAESSSAFPNLGKSLYYLQTSGSRQGLAHKVDFGGELTIISKYSNSSITGGGSARALFTFINESGTMSWRLLIKHLSNKIVLVKSTGINIRPGGGGVTNTLYTAEGYDNKASLDPDTITLTYSHLLKKVSLYSFGVKKYEFNDIDLGVFKGSLYIGISAEITSFTSDMHGVINLFSIYNRVMDDDEVSRVGV